MDVIGFLLTVLAAVVVVLSADLITKRMQLNPDTRKTIMLVCGSIALIYVVLAFLGYVPIFHVPRKL
jgi:small-conductance mechanosensitive channel